jgi:PTH1 family peptidyl-tRNA hydrolase
MGAGDTMPGAVMRRRHLVVGLGNPGRQYQGTRHNVGYEALSLIAAAIGASFRQAARGQLARAPYRGGEALLLKPETYMNLSGEAVAPLARRHGIRPQNLLIVHDDLDLALGRIRFRQGGSDGGHRGVASIIERLGTADFCRLKIGLGRPPEGSDPVEFVLLPPSPAERAVLGQAIERGVAGCLLWLAEGLDAAMNRYNVSPPPERVSPPPERAAPPPERLP